MWLYHRVTSPNDADGMANSVDPDQTATLIWVCTVCPDLSVRKLRNITVIRFSNWTRTHYMSFMVPKYVLLILLCSNKTFVSRQISEIYGYKRNLIKGEKITLHLRKAEELM